MLVQAVLVPLFLQVLLTFAVGILMAVRRGQAFQSGTKYQDIALRQPAWPEPALKAAYAFANQFELPVLFYVAIIVAIFTRHADVVVVVLAWIFVVCRYVQTGIHITGNNVRYRGAWFGLGGLALLIMWVWLAFGIFAGVP
jgi:hypothetical protein